jgi:hypothetical protein
MDIGGTPTLETPIGIQLHHPAKVTWGEHRIIQVGHLVTCTKTNPTTIVTTTIAINQYLLLFALADFCVNPNNSLIIIKCGMAVQKECTTTPRCRIGPGKSQIKIIASRVRLEPIQIKGTAKISVKHALLDIMEMQMHHKLNRATVKNAQKEDTRQAKSQSNVYHAKLDIFVQVVLDCGLSLSTLKLLVGCLQDLEWTHIPTIHTVDP